MRLFDRLRNSSTSLKIRNGYGRNLQLLGEEEGEKGDGEYCDAYKEDPIILIGRDDLLPDFLCRILIRRRGLSSK